MVGGRDTGGMTPADIDAYVKVGVEASHDLHPNAVGQPPAGAIARVSISHTTATEI